MDLSNFGIRNGIFTFVFFPKNKRYSRTEAQNFRKSSIQQLENLHIAETFHSINLQPAFFTFLYEICFESVDINNILQMRYLGRTYIYDIFRKFLRYILHFTIYFVITNYVRLILEPCVRIYTGCFKLYARNL